MSVLHRKLIGYLRARILLTSTRGISAQGTPMFFGRRPIVKAAGRIEIGRAFRVRSRQFRTLLSTGQDGLLLIGDDVYVNQGVTIHAAEAVTIGSHVHLADLVAIYDTNFHPVDEFSSITVAPVVIEDNVWVGRGAIVLPGVTVGRNSVIAAGAVVADDVPPNVVVAGNPARTVRTVVASDAWIRP